MILGIKGRAFRSKPGTHPVWLLFSLFCVRHEIYTPPSVPIRASIRGASGQRLKTGATAKKHRKTKRRKRLLSIKAGSFRFHKLWKAIWAGNIKVAADLGLNMWPEAHTRLLSDLVERLWVLRWCWWSSSRKNIAGHPHHHDDFRRPLQKIIKASLFEACHFGLWDGKENTCTIIWNSRTRMWIKSIRDDRRVVVLCSWLLENQQDYILWYHHIWRLIQIS